MMPPARYDIVDGLDGTTRTESVYAGDDFTLDLSFQDVDGSPMVLDPVGWKAQIRVSPSAAEVLAEITVITTQAPAGKLTLQLSAATTATLRSGVWDLQQTVSGVVTTWVAGAISVRGDVTRA